MSKLQQILDNYPEESFIKLDGLDNAIIGVEASQEPFRLVYSVNDIVDCFC